MDQQRAIRYLTKHYSRFSEKNLKDIFENIIERLIDSGKYDREFLDHVVEGLAEDDWPKYKICAYIDALDLEDRT
tara:strand:- start:170 stop:394 length:225 start_codon:yes stop_codon:yes gene_type:complete